MKKELDFSEAFGKKIQTISFVNTDRIILKLEDGLAMDFRVRAEQLHLEIREISDLHNRE